MDKEELILDAIKTVERHVSEGIARLELNHKELSSKVESLNMVVTRNTSFLSPFKKAFTTVVSAGIIAALTTGLMLK